MNYNHLQIPMDSGDANWKQRCDERMEELRHTQFPSEDAAALQPGLLHKELVVQKEVMISELYEAVENGNVDNFVDLLKQECTQRKLPLSDIFDQVTGAGDSLLHVAAELGKEQIAELISHHFPKLLTGRNVRGDTVLHAAVRSKNSTVVKLILSQYAIGKSKHDGIKDKEITREINELGDTPLHEALYSKDVGVVKEILHADGLVVHYLNKSKRSPLFLAVVSGNVEILNLLLQVPLPADQPLPLCFGNSPLHAAILERNPALIKEILLQRPELVYLRDRVGNTPLHYAAYIGYVEGFHILLKNSLEKSNETILERNKKGRFPIHLACKRGHVEVVKEFLQHEWPINPYALLDQKGQNILHVAAKNGRTNVVQYLLRNRKISQFAINRKDNDGNTPLHLASINLFPKVLYFIAQDKRTNVNITNNNNCTARDIVEFDYNIQMTFRKYLARLVLIEVGVPRKVNYMLRYQRQQPPKRHLRSKDLLNTLIVVATLMVTVTFACAFSVPGGVYSSDDPNPKNRGMAVLAHKDLFWQFSTLNTIAMHCSIIACGLILFAQTSTSELADLATFLAVLCLFIAFSAVPTVFLFAVSLVVDNNHTLQSVLVSIGYVYTVPLTISVFGIFLLMLRPFGGPGLWILRDYVDKPQKATKDKDKDEESNEHV